MLKERHRLKRKQEQVHNQFDPAKHLFQKVYYHPELLQADEVELRQHFIKYNDIHETTNKVT